MLFAKALRPCMRHMDILGFSRGLWIHSRGLSACLKCNGSTTTNQNSDTLQIQDPTKSLDVSELSRLTTSTQFSSASAAPVTVPPSCRTCLRQASTASVSTSPGTTAGMPGGYGHSSSAQILPAAASHWTLQGRNKAVLSCCLLMISRSSPQAACWCKKQMLLACGCNQ